MPEINLLPEEERKQVAAKKLRRRLTIYSVAAIVICAVIAVVVFSFWTMLTREEKQLTESITGFEKQIENLQNVETLARVLKSKLLAIITTSKQATDFDKILTNITQTIPSGVTLSDLTISEQNQIKFSGSAISSSEFSNLVLALLRSNVGKANFSSVSVESVTRDDKGLYKFAIAVKLKGFDESAEKAKK